jgi:hypothetical protein
MILVQAVVISAIKQAISASKRAISAIEKIRADKRLVQTGKQSVQKVSFSFFWFFLPGGLLHKQGSHSHHALMAIPCLCPPQEGH